MKKILIELDEKEYERIIQNYESEYTLSRFENLVLAGHALDKKFEEILVEYPPEDLCTYPEYKGKPYFSIKYEDENGNHIVGFGTYKPEVLSEYLRNYFIDPKVESEE